MKLSSSTTVPFLFGIHTTPILIPDEPLSFQQQQALLGNNKRVCPHVALHHASQCIATNQFQATTRSKRLLGSRCGLVRRGESCTYVVYFQLYAGHLEQRPPDVTVAAGKCTSLWCVMNENIGGMTLFDLFMSIYLKGTVLVSLGHMLFIISAKPPKTCVMFDLLLRLKT